MGYTLCDHTADVAVEATGPTLSAAFATTADGMAAAMYDEKELPTTGRRFDIGVRAENRDALLFDYLDELIYQRDVRSVLPVENEVRVGDGDDWCLSGSARGVPLAGLAAREIKAVTYSEMVVEETDDGWRVYVVFDV